jgi:hypothetical protein
VSEIGITYVRMSCSNGMISVPNSQVLNAVVGPLPPGDYPAPPPPPQPQVWPSAMPPASPAPGPAPASGGDPDRGPDPGDANGASAGPVGTADGAGGAPRPGTSGEQ